jgi:hypothetical protein
MKRPALILGLIGALAVGLPASASDWLKNCQTTGGANSHSLLPGGFACYIPSGAIGATDNSDGMLDVSSCENIDLLWFDDVEGDGVVAGATAVISSCPTSDLSTANGGVGEAACWAIENVTLDGVPGTNTEAIYGVAANWIFVEMVAYATVAEPARLLVRCNGSWR